MPEPKDCKDLNKFGKFGTLSVWHIVLSGHETCEKDNGHYLVVNHIQSQNTDGVFDFLTTSSPISDVVARRH